eukprot:scaffold24783_cov17-Tisochrysis_lutea.AAC.1
MCVCVCVCVVLPQNEKRFCRYLVLSTEEHHDHDAGSYLSAVPLPVSCLTQALVAFLVPCPCRLRSQLLQLEEFLSRPPPSAKKHFRVECRIVFLLLYDVSFANWPWGLANDHPSVQPDCLGHR